MTDDSQRRGARERDSEVGDESRGSSGSGAGGDGSGNQGGSAGRARFSSRRRPGRPAAVYGVLIAGVVTLVVLLVIIYFSATGPETPDQPICTSITAAEAEGAILNGEVEHVALAHDAEVQETASDRWGPVLARVDFADDSCANLPQGVEGQTDHYQILGVISYYNETTEQPQVSVSFEAAENLDEALFATPTPEPTEVPETPEVWLVPVEPTEEPGTPVPADEVATPVEVVPAATPDATTPEAATPEA